MYDLRARHWAPCQLLTGYVYRADSRRPERIALEGFSGTPGTSHAFAAFDSDTVFGSLSVDGVCLFQQLMKLFDHNLPYLYKINVTGLRGYVFRKQHLGPQSARNARQLALIKFERQQARYMNNPRCQQLGQGQVIRAITQVLATRINEAFIEVNEVHVQGPILPNRVMPMGAWTTEEAIESMSTILPPRTRRNSI